MRQAAHAQRPATSTVVIGLRANVTMRTILDVREPQRASLRPARYGESRASEFQLGSYLYVSRWIVGAADDPERCRVRNVERRARHECHAVEQVEELPAQREAD